MWLQQATNKDNYNSPGIYNAQYRQIARDSKLTQESQGMVKFR